MEDVVKNDVLGKFIKERVEENKNLFVDREIEIIKNNNSLIRKLYLLGFVNSRECYKTKNEGGY